VTDSEFQAKYTLLKRLGWLALAGTALVCVAIALGDDQLRPYSVFAAIGAVCIIPVVVYLVILTLWHWKGRYRGEHSNLWGAMLVIETSGWSKLIYLFRHIIPDARKTGRYAASGASSGA
jgi:cytochrome bd-type quinol oxidase subunit 2